MKQLCYEDYEEFACAIADKFDDIKKSYCDIGVVALYEDARHVIEELVGFGYELYFIELESPESDGYEDEYVVSLTEDGIWCEKMLRDKGYIEDWSTFIYVMDGCNSKVLGFLDPEDEMYEVHIGDEDEDEPDCNCCWDYGCPEHPVNKPLEAARPAKKVQPEKHETLKRDMKPPIKEEFKKDEDMHGFSVSRTGDHGYSNFSFYTSEKLDNGMIGKIREIFEV